MCGRFTYPYSWSEIYALYRLTTLPSNLQPRYKVCPTTTINTVITRDGHDLKLCDRSELRFNHYTARHFLQIQTWNI